MSLIRLFLYLWNSIVLVHSESSYCIWKSTEDSIAYINGLYTYNSNLNGYYEKEDTECSANTMYLYNAKNTWYIGSVLADTTDYIAYCNAHITPDTPDDCGDYWRFKESGEYSPLLQIHQDECPSLSDCDLLEVLYWSNTHCRESPDDCCGYYDHYTDSQINNNNIYHKLTIDGNRYLFFSAANFRWVCTKDIADITKTGKCLDLTTSDTVDAYSLTPVWYDMTSNQIRKYPWNSNKNKTAYFVCETADPATAPTQPPTINITVPKTTNSTSQYTTLLTIIITICSVVYILNL